MRESSGVAAGLTALPSGAAGIAPLGDRFQPDLVRGSGSYGVPLTLPAGPNDLKPALSLTYSTGGGNGPFGLGWRLDLLRIERRTDRGVPRYGDTDQYVIAGAEVLVDVGGGRYRTQTETRFWHIERVGDGWRVRTGDGRTLVLGQTDSGRERDAAGRIFAWCLEEERDAAGNAIAYRYRRDGDRLLLAEIAWSIFSLAISYEPRPDVLRDGRAGFLRTVTLRARAIALHCARESPTLLRSYTLSYTRGANGVSLLERLRLAAERDGDVVAMPELAFTYSPADFVEWDITEPTAVVAPPDLFDPSTQLVDLTGDGLPDLLQSAGSRMYLWRNGGDGRLDGPTAIEGVPSTVQLSQHNVAFADLDGNGRVDLFAVDQPLQLAFSSNGRGGFDSQPVVFRSRPSLGLADDNTRLFDIDGDGVVDLLSTERDHLLLWPHEPGVGWLAPVAVPRVHDLARFPDLSFGDQGVRLADMTGDGLRDFVLLRSGDVSYWPYLGDGRWGARVEMDLPPQLPAGFREEDLHLVDLDGDGCADVVHIDHDRILVWLNETGNRFAAPITVPIAPVTGDRRVAVADFAGDGRPSLLWSQGVNRANGAGFRVLRFDGGRVPYLLAAIDNGIGGRYEMDYATSTAMRRADAEDGHEWAGILPLVVPVVSRIRQVDTLAGRVHEMRIRYHDGVWDGPRREFRGFRAVTVDVDGDDSIPATRQELAFFQGEPEHPDLIERLRQRTLAGSPLSSETLAASPDGWQRQQSSMHTWDVRVEHDAGPDSVMFPFLTTIEAREHSVTGAPDRVERTSLRDYDAHGNPGRRVRDSFAEDEPPEDWIRTEERFTYTSNQADWLVKLPVRLELRDGDGVPFAVRVTTYDGAAFVGLPEGQATNGLVTRVEEAKLLAARLPAGYAAGRDFATLGYAAGGIGDTAGWYATVVAHDRDARGNVTVQHDPLGHPLTIDYDSDGVYPVRTVDARGRETRLAFDPRAGEPHRIELPDGRVVRYIHDAIGRLAGQLETDDNGIERLTKAWAIELGAQPSITSLVPGAPGADLDDLLAADPAALVGVSVSRQYYDGFGGESQRISRGPDGSGGERRFVRHPRPVLNPRGLTRVLLPATFATDLAAAPAPAELPPGSIRHYYDAAGRPEATAGPGPVRQRVVRDTFTITHFEGASAGNLDAPPPGPASRVEDFDARGRLVRVRESDGAGGEITTAYDLTLDGRIAVVRDDAGDVTVTYQFAGPGEPVRIAARDASTRTFYRDAADLLVERVDADGSALLHHYDDLRRLVRVEHLPGAGGSVEVVRELVYDTDPDEPDDGRFLDGRIAVARDTGHTARYAYNRTGQVVSETSIVDGIGLTVEREYDFQGRLVAIVYPDGGRQPVISDDSGSLSEVTGVVRDIAYDADGVVTGYTFANGARVSATVDIGSRRLQTLALTDGGGATLRRLDYAHDTVGNVTGVRDTQPGDVIEQRFGYDALHRLGSFEIRADNAAGPLLRRGDYRYDPVGNLLTLPEIGPLDLRYTDAAHPGRVATLDRAGTIEAVGYDARGRTTALGTLQELDYDALDRLVRVVRGDGTEISFDYDHQGHRVRKTVTAAGQAPTTVRYAGGLWEQHDDHAFRHVHFGRRLVATDRVATGVADVRAYFFSDHLGTVVCSLDSAGAVIAQQRYTPFGVALDGGAALDRYLGRERDAETGLVQLGARFYAAGMGRFLTPDWYVLEHPDKPMRMPQAYNLYAYAMNSPLVFKDPSGLWFGLDDLIVAGVGFVVGFVSGLVYGLANGQGWDSLLTALETGLTTAAGAWLGWTIGGPVGAVMGGMNGLVSGIHGIYDWSSVDGWFAFLSDSTWGLIGTSLGNVVHLINLFYDDANYREDLSRRQNRHVYEGGFALKSNFAFTQGNVISNAGLGQGAAGISASFLADHEELHIWQSRFFGPVFQATYIVWAVGGFLVATVVWFTDTSENWGSLVETAAYYDNPFETWAYKNDSFWPPTSANPKLTWA
jgi:RHS repeat-associated protein